MMNIPHYIAVGSNGKIQSFGLAESVKRAPEFRVRVNRCPVLLGSFFTETKGYALQYLEKWYANLGQKHYAPFKDEMHVLRVGNIWTMTAYGAQTFPAPALTADVVPFLRTSDGPVFLGIIRGADPGKGKPALIGGFREVRGKHFQTPLECLIQEGKEEAGFHMTALNHSEVERIDQEQIFVIVRLGNYKVPAAALVLRVGDFQTSSEEEVFGGEEMRVNQTTAYACVVDVPTLSTTDIIELLTFGDDASGLAVQSTAVMPDFGIRHHRAIYEAALKIVREHLAK